MFKICGKPAIDYIYCVFIFYCGCMRILVVEDEYAIGLDIKTRLEDMGFEDIVLVGDFEDGLMTVVNNEPDIALLDINLGGKRSGIDLARIIREKYNFPIIFITAYSDKNTLEDSIGVAPDGYITKPFKDVDLRNCILLAVNKFGGYDNSSEENAASAIKNQEEIFVREKGSLIKIRKKSIYWIEAMDNYTIIHLKNKKHLVNSFLKDVLENLGEDFIRIHRSYAISIDKIAKIDSNCVIIGDKAIAIGVKYKNDLMTRINLLNT